MDIHCIIIKYTIIYAIVTLQKLGIFLTPLRQMFNYFKSKGKLASVLEQRSIPSSLQIEHQVEAQGKKYLDEWKPFLLVPDNSNRISGRFFTLTSALMERIDTNYRLCFLCFPLHQLFAICIMLHIIHLEINMNIYKGNKYISDHQKQNKMY